MQDKLDAISDLERKAAKVEAIFTSEKEALFGGVDEQMRRAEEMLNQALTLRGDVAAKRSKSQHAASAMGAEVENQRRQWQQEREGQYKALILTLDMLMNHKENVRSRLQAVLVAAQQAKAKVDAL